MKLPPHLHSFEGSLFDNRKGWKADPIRPVYSRHFREIETGQELRASLRAGEYAWPGGYACFFLTSDGAVLSFAAVRENLRAVLWSIRNRCNDGWRVVGLECTANCDESPVCEHSGESIS